ncbi:hypothetical protein FisN_31Hu010 [Fistulifera solaris]|uniref:Ubiquitin-like domain-containing protein n=1 Tax=Fistulifera solaris TaxID=1519565 RepID=A0A1Z5JW25_FISSO|nr:hypothetical protein FisN_31Hu010 [Fistulifera solaris]|eukprot:GAX18237.1 hypothetical protein FisN_31Hu010 [Fistulifera solaris]
MEISIKTPTLKIIPLTVDPLFTVKVVKLVIQEKEGIPPSQQRLIYAGKEMIHEERTLQEYLVEAESKLWLVLRLRGGLRGRGPPHLMLVEPLFVPPEMQLDPVAMVDLKMHVKSTRDLDELLRVLQVSLTGDCYHSLHKIHHWVMGLKNEHAGRVIEIVVRSCFGQRIEQERYEKERQYVHTFKAYHKVLQAAMKTKNSVDMRLVSDLERSLQNINQDTENERC